MVMKYIKMLRFKMFNTKRFLCLCYIYLQKRGGFPMMKFLAKVAEKYAKATNTSCVAWWVLHQPKMPASLIKKD